MKILFYSEYLKEGSNAIDGDNQFVKQLKNKLTFQYKVRKDKFISVKEITGDITETDLDITIKFSNKDTIDIKFNSGEIKIKINGELIYHLDEIVFSDVINLVYKTYEKYLQQQNITIVKKENPFK